MQATVSTVGGPRLGGVSWDAATGTDKHAGLATGSALATSATFDDFMIQKREAKCQTCSRCNGIPFTDSFPSGALDPNWIQSSGSTWSIASAQVGVVVPAVSFGSLSRCINSPDPNGLSILGQVDVTYHDTTRCDEAVLRVYDENDFNELVADFATGDYSYSGPGYGGSIAQAPADGDRLAILIEDVSSGAGTYDITFRINGVDVHTESAVLLAYTIGGSFSTQLIAFQNGSGGSGDTVARFDNYSITSP
jgi:hypothetical protein